MTSRKLLQLEWPELKTKVVAEPLDVNHALYDWFMTNVPMQAVQTHVAVSGQSIYIINLRLKHAPNFSYRDLVEEYLPDTPVGRVGSGSLATGLVGSIGIKYGELYERMSYPNMAQIRAEDIEKFKKVGEAVWRSFYFTKEIIHCNIGALEA